MQENVRIQTSLVAVGLSCLTLTWVGSEFSNFESFKPQSAWTMPRRDSNTWPGIHKPRLSSWLSMSSWWKHFYGPTSNTKHSVAMRIGFISGSSNTIYWINWRRLMLVSAYFPPMSSINFFVCVGICVYPPLMKFWAAWDNKVVGEK